MALKRQHKDRWVKAEYAGHKPVRNMSQKGTSNCWSVKVFSQVKGFIHTVHYLLKRDLQQSREINIGGKQYVYLSHNLVYLVFWTLFSQIKTVSQGTWEG